MHIRHGITLALLASSICMTIDCNSVSRSPRSIARAHKNAQCAIREGRYEQAQCMIEDLRKIGQLHTVCKLETMLAKAKETPVEECDKASEPCTPSTDSVCALSCESREGEVARTCTTEEQRERELCNLRTRLETLQNEQTCMCAELSKERECARDLTARLDCVQKEHDALKKTNQLLAETLHEQSKNMQNQSWAKAILSEQKAQIQEIRQCRQQIESIEKRFANQDALCKRIEQAVEDMAMAYHNALGELRLSCQSMQDDMKVEQENQKRSSVRHMALIREQIGNLKEQLACASSTDVETDSTCA